MSEKGTYAVIDGNSLMHRAFHAVPPTMSSKDGRPTNAVFGFLTMFVKLIEDFAPDGVVVVFDKGRPQARIDILPQYKAQRPPRDPDLSAQFPMVKKILLAMGVPIFELEGWEGDDLLGSVAIQGRDMGYDMLLVTGDRDSYQLVDEHIHVVANKKGMSEVVVYGPDEVRDLYDGVEARLIPDFYGLKGDTSDNIPGVPGIGPKKASALIVEYGDLEAVLSHADEIPGKMGQNIREHIDDARVSCEVARIRTDAPIEFDPQGAAWPNFEVQQAIEAFDELSLIAMKHRVLGLLDPKDRESQPSVLPNVSHEILEGDQAFDALEEALNKHCEFGVYLDDDEDALNKLFSNASVLWVACGSGWKTEGYRSCAYRASELIDHSSQPIQEVPTAAFSATSSQGIAIPAGIPLDTPARILKFEDDDVIRSLKLLYTQGQVSSFDVKSDIQLLIPEDSSQNAFIPIDEIAIQNHFDAGIAAYLLDSNRSDYSPQSLIQSFTPWNVSEDVSGACLAAYACALRHILTLMLDVDGTRACMEHIEMPLCMCLVELERAGMCIDAVRLHELSAELGNKIQELATRIYDEAQGEFNIDSPQQLSHVLFERLGLPTTDPESLRPLKKTKRGYYSTNAKILEAFAKTNPVVADVLEYREHVKIKSTYLDALPGQVSSGDKKVHTSFHQKVTTTGRLSSSNPNLQNIPIRSDLGKMVRTAFVPSDDEHVILSCDYSQIELRLLAHLSQDPGLIAAFESGEDFHTQTAASVFGVNPGDVTPYQRSRAKAVNFGIVYGQTSWGLSQSLKISPYEAQEIIDRYYKTYPTVRSYLDEQVEFARKHGWVATMYGRKRHVPDISSRVPAVKQFAERTAMNHPVQGSAADIIKLSMLEVEKRLRLNSFTAQMIVQVHDELVFDCPKTELDELSSVVVDAMQTIARLRVPLVVSCATGTNWAEAK